RSKWRFERGARLPKPSKIIGAGTEGSDSESVCVGVLGGGRCFLIRRIAGGWMGVVRCAGAVGPVDYGDASGVGCRGDAWLPASFEVDFEGWVDYDAGVFGIEAE